jgi:hypothetical protein
MYRRALSTGAAIALFLGMAAMGCSDTAVDSSSSNDDAAFAMYTVDEVSLTDLSEVPTEEQVFAKDPVGDPSGDKTGGKGGDTTGGKSGDTTGGKTGDKGGDTTGGKTGGKIGDKGGDTTGGNIGYKGGHTTGGTSGGKIGDKSGDTTGGKTGDKKKGGGLDWGKVKLHSYKPILAQLDLSDEQKAAIRTCFVESHECVESAVTRYRAVRSEKSDELHAALEQVRAAVEDGSMTREEGGAAIKRLISAYREEISALNRTLKAAVDTCQAQLEACIEGHLTDEQLVRWNRLKG